MKIKICLAALLCFGIGVQLYTACQINNQSSDISDMRKELQLIHAAHPTVPVIIARLSDKSKNHGENLMESEPYLASWFAYWLKGDKEAGMAFMGASPETIVLPLLFPL